MVGGWRTWRGAGWSLSDKCRRDCQGGRRVEDIEGGSVVTVRHVCSREVGGGSRVEDISSALFDFTHTFSFFQASSYIS